ncbi:hypothetical protein E2562_016983 [Oryza meyeriana var. granulata]|uniref:Uncharacterized protein n=1 Tax=Oryza meyeriana var. granulata TaxID=110450 RepID=A0A6G1EAD3_9ORYZ|nr:hypothetical protein E2562_016983 [Oryza meyeriana var. granulata]
MEEEDGEQGIRIVKPDSLPHASEVEVDSPPPHGVGWYEVRMATRVKEDDDEQGGVRMVKPR